MAEVSSTDRLKSNLDCLFQRKKLAWERQNKARVHLDAVRFWYGKRIGFLIDRQKQLLDYINHCVKRVENARAADDQETVVYYSDQVNLNRIVLDIVVTEYNLFITAILDESEEQERAMAEFQCIKAEFDEVYRKFEIKLDQGITELLTFVLPVKE